MANNIPYHLGVIMDGNRRWAKSQGLPALEGHRRGYEKFKKLAKWCKNKGIKILSLYAFSTENWDRAKEEVGYLMDLLAEALTTKEVKELHKEGIKLNIIGQRERLSDGLQKAIKKAEDITKDNKEGILNVCLNYGGQVEIIEAVRKIVSEKIAAKDITKEVVEDHLWTAGQPHPDLIIRTSGEYRLSGFLTWQSAYSELYFSDKYWPEFSEEDLDKALAEYSSRQRRYGQ